MARRSLVGVATALVCGILVPAAAGAATFGQISTFGSLGEGAGQFKGTGLATGPSGDFFVADGGNARIDQFGPDGTFIRAVGNEVDPAGGDVCTAATTCQAATKGEAAGQFHYVEGIAIGPEGDVYVVDSFNKRVDVLTSELQFVRAFGEGVLDGSHEPQVCTTSCQAGLAGNGAGEMDSPYAIAVDPASGELFVTDYNNHRVDVYKPDGTFLRAFGKEVEQGGGGDVCTEVTGCKAGVSNSTAGAIEETEGIAIPPGGGDVYVVDSGAKRIEQFTQAGDFVRAFGKKVNVADESDICTEASECQGGAETDEAGGFAYPFLDVFDAAGNLYVGDYDNSRVAVYTAAGEFEYAFGGGVIEGSTSEEFEVCTADTGCQEGDGESGPGSVMHPEGIALGAGCDLPGLYVMGYQNDSPPREISESHIGHFGDPSAANPCPPPPEEKHEAISPPPSNKVTLGKLKLNKKRGTALLAVSVPSPGSLVLSGKGVRGKSARASGATTVNLTVSLAGKAKKKLVKTGKAKVKVSVAFTPDGGTAGTASKSITLKKTKTKS